MTTMTKYRIPYIATVSLIGLLLVAWAAARFQTDNPWLFVTFLLLVAAAQVASNVSKHIKVTFSLATAASLATAVLFGLEAGILVATVENIVIWLFNIYAQRENWVGSCQQLFFNTGIHTIATFLGGSVLLFLLDWFRDPLLGPILSWFATAVFYDQINIALLAIIIYLQQGIPPRQFWAQQHNAIVLDIGNIAILGLLLTIASTTLGVWGILLFIFPLLLASYAIYLYMNETNKQMAVIQKQADLLAETNRSMEAWSREKARFMAVLSHDMRNSLNVIRLYSETLKELEEIPFAKRQRMARVILLSEHDLTSAVDNLLEIERMQTGEPLRLSLTQVNVAELIHDAVAMQMVEAADKEIDIFVDEKLANVQIEGDKLLLMRVLTNLLSNGVKYTPQGGSLSVTLVPRVETVEIGIADTGYGIPHGELDNIFKPFYRVPKHEQQAKGTGLGLAIVKHYVEAHRGKIRVDSQEGRGSVFSIQLPVLQTD